MAILRQGWQSDFFFFFFFFKAVKTHFAGYRYLCDQCDFTAKRLDHLKAGLAKNHFFLFLKPRLVEYMGTVCPISLEPFYILYYIIINNLLYKMGLDILDIQYAFCKISLSRRGDKIITKTWLHRDKMVALEKRKIEKENTKNHFL